MSKYSDVLEMNDQVYFASIDVDANGVISIDIAFDEVSHTIDQVEKLIDFLQKTIDKAKEIARQMPESE